MRRTMLGIGALVLVGALAGLLVGCESAGGEDGLDVVADTARDAGGGQDTPPSDAPLPPDTPLPEDIPEPPQDVPQPPEDVPQPPEDVPDPEDTTPPGPYGFTLRTPDPAAYTCADEPWDDGQMGDVDHVCTFAYGGVDAVIYLQATPVGCESVGMSWAPVFSTTAWLSIDGAVTPLDAPLYDHGGNHNNDFAEFTYDGTRFRLWHSSFGFGWRKCQPMDCIYVLAADGTTIAEDGCDPTRTLPVTCDRITAEHGTPDLTDDFALCNGDDGT